MIIAATAKIFLAELIEESRALMAEEEDNIRPEHLELAFMKLNAQGKLDFREPDLKRLFSD